MEITNKPTIRKRVLSEETLSLSFDLERNMLSAEAVLDTEFEAAKDADRRTRPRQRLRGEEATAALDEILPDDENVVWTNPRKTLKGKVAAFLAEHIDD